MPRPGPVLAADSRSYADHPPQPLGGALCLDFINTVTWRGDPARRSERLRDYGELVYWASGLDLIGARMAAALRAEATARPQRAMRALALSLELRRALEDAFDGPRDRPADFAVADALIRDMAKIGRLSPRATGEHHWQATLTPPDLRLPLLPVAISAMALAVSGRRRHLRSCADPHCGWMFLDETRNHSRQWCSMADCGNRAKARAHYARRKAAGT